MNQEKEFSKDHILYRQWLQAAHDAAQGYDGSERMMDVLFAPLIEMDRHVRASNDNSSSAEIEAELADQIWPGATFRTINDFIEAASEVYSRKLNNASDLDGALALLNAGGGIIKRYQETFVQTDEGKLQPSDQDGKGYEFRTQPRLNYLIGFLKNHGIYTDDIVAHVGEPDRQMMRRLPYVIVQIPRLDKELAVCDEVGQTTFAATKILGPDVWLHLRKSELEARSEIASIDFINREYWEGKIEAVLFGGENPGAKVNIGVFAGQKPPLDIALIKKSIRAHRDATDRFPAASGPVEHGPYQGRETWNAINSALTGNETKDGTIQSRRRLPGGSTLAILNAEVAAELGLNYVNPKKQENLTIDNIKASIRAHREATGNWPTQNSGTVEYGPYRGRETWAGINIALMGRKIKDGTIKSVRGLPVGSSLSKIVREVAAELGMRPPASGRKARDHLISQL